MTEQKTSNRETDASIDILLSTYNGERYLPVLLESLASQTVTGWRLIVRDDGSKDHSLEIIRRFSEGSGCRVELVDDSRGNIGARASFAGLLEHSESDYIMFADQDDLWMPDKIECLLDAMQLAEGRFGSGCPLLLHSDLQVVDENLSHVAASFWRYQHLKPSSMQVLNRLLVQNCVTGCASMINASLREAALPVANDAVMHDWWLALVAAANGHIVEIDRPTIKYRQHEENEIGAKKWGGGYILKMLARGADSHRQSLQATYRQARALSAMLGSTHPCHELVSDYMDIPDRGFVARRLAVLRGGYIKYGLARNIAMLLWI